MPEAAQTSRGSGPWVGIIALIAAGAVLCIGVLRGLDPDVILLRALCSAVLLGGLAWGVYRILYSP